MSESRDRRIQALKQLIRSEDISSQDELVKALKSQGFRVTQSSISRDLRELGIGKVRGVYHVDGGEQEEALEELKMFASAMVDIVPAGPNLLVIHTAIGSASRIALLIDQHRSEEIVGTIAGDDTIFIATKGRAEQKKLHNRLKRILREKDHGD